MGLGRTLKNGALEAEVVIIGGGAAGLPAAVTAVENGATKVVLLEKRINVGGNASRAEGLFGCGSHLQRKMFIDASPDNIYKRVMKYHHFSRIDPRILRAYLKKSGQTIDWLEQKGIVFRVGTNTRLRFDQLPTWHIPEGNCAAMVKALSKNCKELGVQVLLRTTAKKILHDGQGRVNGVVAERDKEEFQIKARSVIISTGGFGGNKQILKKYFPYYNDGFIVSSLPYSGDGIKLAEEAGAAIEDFACMQKESGFGATGLIFCLMREPNLVCVNKIGVRFFDEDALGYYPMEGGNVIIRQPDQVYYCLFDEKIGQSMEEIGFLLGRPGVHRGESGQPLPGLRKELKTEPAYMGWAKIADSWDEIANWIGAEPKLLEGTIDEYNHFCDQGYDEAFVKDRRYLEPLRTPPYYAVKIKPIMTDTIGPIRINERMEVLDSQCNPIAGLYAAGVITSGWQSEEYCSDICGTCMGYSTNSGRIAAENAVKFALGK